MSAGCVCFEWMRTGEGTGVCSREEPLLLRPLCVNYVKLTSISDLIHPRASILWHCLQQASATPLHANYSTLTSTHQEFMYRLESPRSHPSPSFLSLRVNLTSLPRLAPSVLLTVKDSSLYYPASPLCTPILPIDLSLPLPFCLFLAIVPHVG